MSKPPTPPAAPSATLEFPCDLDTLRSFISGLLGKPQTLEQNITGPFELTKDEVTNIFHLVDQRVQQNQGVLVQFTVKIIYQDGSTVLLNSLQDFSVYNEVRPIMSVAAILSWNYLIKFPDKAAPEKQQIELTFSTSHRNFLFAQRGVSESRPVILLDDDIGHMAIRIEHTARTWGVDLESLLRNHLETLLIYEPWWKLRMCQYSAKIGSAIGGLCITIATVGLLFTINNFVAGQMGAAQKLMGEPATTLQTIGQKLDFVVGLAASGQWARLIFGCVIYLLVTMVISITIGIWAGTSIDNRHPSFVLLSKKAIENKTITLKKRKKSWYNFWISFVLAIATGLIVRIIFALTFEKWFHQP
jgi:hypothetical protein